MDNLRKNKKGFVMTTMLIYIILASIVAILFFTLQSFRLLLLAGAGIVFFSILLFNQTSEGKKFNDSYLFNAFLLLLILISAFGLIYLSVAQSSFGVFSNSQINIDGQDTVIITGTLRGGQEIIFSLTPSDIKAQTGYDADKTTTISFKFLGSEFKFPYRVNSGTSLYGIKDTLLGKFGTWSEFTIYDCPTDSGEFAIGGYKVDESDNWFFDLKDTFYCVYATPTHSLATWTNMNTNNIKKSVTFNGETKTMDLISNQNEIMFSDGTIVKGMGQLGTGYTLQTPNYKIAIRDSDNEPILVEEDAYAINDRAIESFRTCMGVNKVSTWQQILNFAGRNDVDASWSNNDLDKYRDCKTQFTTKNTDAITSKDIEWRNGVDNVQSISYNYGVMNVIISQPTFANEIITIMTTKEVIGVRTVQPQPEIISASDIILEASGVGKSLVKFTTNIDGKMQIYAECGNDVTALQPSDVYAFAGKVNEAEVSISGTNINDKNLVEECKIIVRSEKDIYFNYNSDEIWIKMTITPLIMDECATIGAMACLNDVVATCNSDFQWEAEKTCSEGCFISENGIALCRAENMCLVDSECKSNQECDSGFCKDKEKPENECSVFSEQKEIYETSWLGLVKKPTGEYECKLKDETWVGGALIFALLFAFIIIANNPNRKLDPKYKLKDKPMAKPRRR